MNAHISNLQDLSPKPVKIMMDKERTVVFDMFALATLEDQYGTQEAAFAAFGSGKIKDVCTFLWAGLLHEDENLTINSVMKMVGIGKIQALSDLIMLALDLGLSDPNAKTSQN
jgi:hypothetical protein